MNSKLKYAITLITSSMLMSTAVSAESGAYIGIKGGYNSMAFPDNTFDTSAVVVNGIAVPNGNTTKAKNSKYFINVNVGYLFPVSQHLQIGPQLGYTYYGKIALMNRDNQVLKDQSWAFDIQQTGVAQIQWSSVNISAVAEYDFFKYFAQLRAGAFYMIGPSKNNYSLTSLTTPDLHIYQSIYSTSSLNLGVGVSIGGYITQNISLALSYDHIFGKNYKDSNFNDLGNYNKSVTVKAPSMDLIGAQVSYHF